MSKMVFYLFFLSPFFNFLKIKEDLAQAPKTFYIFFAVAHFRVTVKMLKLPAPSQKVIFQREILELGSYNNLTQHDMCPIFLLQPSLHPCAQASHAGKKRITNFFKHFLSTCTV